MPAAKLALTADLHLPITPAGRVAELARQMAEFGPDAAVVAGDLGESLADFTRCLELLTEPLRCPVWVLPGEHDFWARPPYDSHRLWAELLPQAVKAAGCRWLEGSAFVLGDTAVAGTVGWYDYSAADPSVRASALTFAQEKYKHNADALRIDWEWSDPEFAEKAAAPFLAALDHLEADPAVRRVVVVTHHPALEDQLTRDPANSDSAFACAYQGNLTLGRKVLARAKVSHVVSGHTHRGRNARVERPGAGPVEAFVLAGDYEKPAWLGLTPGAEG